MSKNVKHLILSAFALALASVAVVFADPVAGASASARLILQGTYIDSGYYGSHGLQVPRDTYTAIGKPLVVTCPRSGGSCVIEADLFIQSGLSDVTGNQYNLCLFVDGNRAPNCQITGSTPADASYTVGTTSQLVTGVAPGDHTVQAFFLTYKGAKVFNFTSNFRVYE